MKKIHLLTLLATCSGLFFVSCKKETISAPVDKPLSVTYTSLSKVFDEAAARSKSITLDASSGGSFYGYSGTRYVFYPNSFIDASGNLVTGNVDIDALECTNEGDMIFSRMLTMSNGNMLISGGEIKITATQGGNPVYIRPGYNYSVKMPTNNGLATAGMDLFRGFSSSEFTGSMVDWTLVKGDSTMAIVYDGDTIVMTPDSLGMSNIDKFTGMGTETINVKIDGVSGTLKSDDVAAYYILEGMLGAASFPSSKFASNTYTSVDMVSAKCHLVAFAIHGGDFYAGISSSITPTSGSTYTLTLSKTTPAAFKVAINALP